MGKMVDKDELEFLRKMAKEGNLESNLNKSNPKVDALRRMASERSITAGSNIDRALGSKMASSAQKDMLGEVSKKLGKSGLLKGLGKAASLAVGPLVGLASQVAEASPIDRSSAEFDPNVQESNIAKMLENEPANAAAKRSKDKWANRMKDIAARNTPESLTDTREDITRIEQDFNDRNFDSEEIEQHGLDRLNEERRKEGILKKIQMSQFNDPNFKPIK